MNRRSASLLALVAFALTASFGWASSSATVKTASRTTQTKWAARRKSPAPPLTHVGFLSAPQIPVGGYDFTTYFPPVSGDFNGDGKKDAATVVKNVGTKYEISVVLGNGDGTFGAPVLTLTTTNAADPIWVGDVDGDGKDDLVMGHQGATASFEVWLSNGDGTFTSQGISPLSTPSHVTWGTLYLNPISRNLDLVIADGVNSLIWSATGQGNGLFDKPTSAAFSPAISPNANVAFADFDGDGFLDFAATDALNNQDEVFFGKSGGYNAPVLLDTQGHHFDSCFDAAGDLNGDGKMDIVSAGANCNTADLLANVLTVYLNTPDGRFTSVVGVPYTVGIRPEAVTIADVNGDGKNDVVTVTTQPGNVRVLLGDGTGVLGAPSVGFATGGNVKTQALVADFNNDGHADLMVSDLEFSLIYFEGYGDGNFRAAHNYYAATLHSGFHPNGVGIASGDFNGDGIPDFVIGNHTDTAASGFTVFISNPDGSLQPGVNYNENLRNTSDLQYVAVADFNGDGKLDIATANAFDGTVQIYDGLGNGTFSITPATYTASTKTSPSALGLVVGDFNGDGKPDVAVVINYGPGVSAEVGVLVNNGAGFNPVTSYGLSALGTEITAADLNGDAKLDLVVPLYGDNTTPGTAVAVLTGKGDGTFNAAAEVALGLNNPYAATVADLNGDGKMDLAVTIDDQITGNQGIAVALGKGDGTFNAATLLLSTLQNPAFDLPLPAYVKAVDLDRDGHLDLVYTNSELGTVGILYGKGDGTFYDPVEFAAGHRAFDIALGDVNKDGVVDVVTSGNAAIFSGVTVLLNTSGNSTALQQSAASTPSGTAVTFTATVTGSPVKGVTAVPSGTASFYDGATKLGSGALNSSKQATFTTSALTVGTHNITAQYSGDTNYVPTTSPVVVHTVTGAGQPDYTLTPSPTTKAVNAGTSATFAITQATGNGYDGTVTFAPTSCSGLPAGAACAFNPATITGAGTTTLTITTTAPTAAMLNTHQGSSNLWASLGGIGVFGMLLAGDWKKRNRRRMGIMLTVIAVAMILALVGCGGGSSSSGGGGGGGGGGTPAGNYIIQVSVTGTAGDNGGSTAAHTLTTPITLTVN